MICLFKLRIKNQIKVFRRIEFCVLRSGYSEINAGIRIEFCVQTTDTPAVRMKLCICRIGFWVFGGELSAAIKKFTIITIGKMSGTGVSFVAGKAVRG